MDVTSSTSVDLRLGSVAKRWKTCVDLRANLISTKVSTSYCIASQVNARAGKAWPNGVASGPKFSTCVYLRVRLGRAYFSIRDFRAPFSKTKFSVKMSMFAKDLSNVSFRALCVRFSFDFMLAQLRTTSVIKGNSDSNTNSWEKLCNWFVREKSNFTAKIWASVVLQPQKKQEHCHHDTLFQLIARRVYFQLKTNASKIPPWRAMLKIHVHALKKLWRRRVW